MSAPSTMPSPTIIIDLDGTITQGDSNSPYPEQKPQADVIQAMRAYREKGFKIVVFSARNMRTYAGNIGKINVHTLPLVLEWLDRHEVPYDEVVLGKPWCGHGGFYVDDRAVRPDEFARLSHEELERLISDVALQ